MTFPIVAEENSDPLICRKLVQDYIFSYYGREKDQKQKSQDEIHVYDVMSHANTEEEDDFA